jgi:hypothetical protein
MVTKVGRGGNLLICSDCGVPVEKLQGQLEHRQRLYGALALIGLSLVGGMIFFLAAMEERLAPDVTKTGQREGGAEKGEKGQRLLEPALLAPDPEPSPATSHPAVPSKPSTAEHAKEPDHGQSDDSTLPLPLKLRTQPGDHRPEP